MNLSEISFNFKSAIKYLGIGLVVLFILWLLWLLLVFLFGLINPKKIGPDIAFGKLPVPFTANFVPSPNLFSLETPGGVLPIPPTTLKVYKVPNVEGKFTSLENAKKIARSNGLDADPDKISENEWQFTSNKVRARNLKYNIVTGNFVFTYDWVSDPSSLVGIFKTNDAEITKLARSFIKDFNSLKPDLVNGKSRITFWKLAGKDKNQVSSYSDANAVLVEIFRDKLEDKYEVIEGNPDKSSINVLISAAQKTEKKLLELNYTYWHYDKAKIGTYPPKTPLKALDDLKKGNGYAVIGGSEVFDYVEIAKISLAYLNPITEVRYFQPIYVFEGDGLVKGVRKSFVAYVSAISSNYQQ